MWWGLTLQATDPASHGVDQGAGRDPNAATRVATATGGAVGDNVGSVQGGATARPSTALTTNTTGAHDHMPGSSIDIGWGGGTLGLGVGRADGNTPANRWGINIAADGDHAHSVTGGGDAETRPKNAYVNWMIKF